MYIRKDQAEPYKADYKSTVLADAMANDPVIPFHPSRLVYSIKEFKEKAKFSNPPFFALLNKGVIDDAVVRLSKKKLYIDFPLAMRLIQEYSRRQGKD